MIRSTHRGILAGVLLPLLAGVASGQGAWNFETARIGQVFNASTQQSCTGAMIGADLVLTAAHCVVEAGNTVPVAARQITFSLRGAERSQQVSAISDIATHPEFIREDVPSRDHVALDMALLRLATPIPGLGDNLADVAARQDVLAVLPNGSDEALSPEPCSASYEAKGVIVLDCAKPEGASGAPVYGLFENGRRIVGVISASGVKGENVVTFAASPALYLTELEWAGRARAKPTGY